MSPNFGFFVPNERNASASTIVPMPMMIAPAPRTIVSAR
jgi:hypothetical protein